MADRQVPDPADLQLVAVNKLHLLLRVFTGPLVLDSGRRTPGDASCFMPVFLLHDQVVASVRLAK